MESLLKFIKLTVVGGALFLLPIALLTVLISKILPVAQIVVDPFSKMLTRHQIVGVALGTVFAIAVLFVSAANVRLLDMPVRSVTKILRQLGAGSRSALQKFRFA